MADINTTAFYSAEVWAMIGTPIALAAWAMLIRWFQGRMRGGSWTSSRYARRWSSVLEFYNPINCFHAYALQTRELEVLSRIRRVPPRIRLAYALAISD